MIRDKPAPREGRRGQGRPSPGALSAWPHWVPFPPPPPARSAGHFKSVHLAPPLRRLRSARGPITSSGQRPHLSRSTELVGASPALPSSLVHYCIFPHRCVHTHTCAHVHKHTQGLTFRQSALLRACETTVPPAAFPRAGRIASNLAPPPRRVPHPAATPTPDSSKLPLLVSSQETERSPPPGSLPRPLKARPGARVPCPPRCSVHPEADSPVALLACLATVSGPAQLPRSRPGPTPRCRAWRA